MCRSPKRKGCSRSVREAIHRLDFHDPALSAYDRAVTRFVAELVARPRVGEDVFAAVRENLTEREIVEVLQVAGFYWSFGRVCTVLDVEIVGCDVLA